MKGKKIQKAKGGGIDLVSGNPNVIAEARAKRATGGRVFKQFRAGGKVVGFMTGGSVRPRLDKPGRKSGGKVDTAKT